MVKYYILAGGGGGDGGGSGGGGGGGGGTVVVVQVFTNMRAPPPMISRINEQVEEKGESLPVMFETFEVKEPMIWDKLEKSKPPPWIYAPMLPKRGHFVGVFLNPLVICRRKP